MTNNSSNGSMPHTPRTAAPDSPVINETLRRLRNQSPAESLGLPAGNGLLRPFIQASIGGAILLVLLTVIPYFVDPPKAAEAKVLPPAEQKQEPTETPKSQPEPKTPVNAKGPSGKSDILDKLGENATKTASPKINPLDKKDDDILKDIK